MRCITGTTGTQMDRETFPADEIESRYGTTVGDAIDLGGAGGFSGARFWRCSASDGTSLCVRQWPRQSSIDRIRLVHEVICDAAQHVGTLAPPITALDQSTCVSHEGSVFELQRWLPGEADVSAAIDEARLHAAFQALADLHAAFARSARYVPAHAIPAAVTSRLKRIRALQRGELAQIANATRSSHALGPLAAQVVECAPTLLQRFKAELKQLNRPAPLQLCLRDVRREHVLFREGAVTGIVDYDAIQVDTPATDIGRLASSFGCDYESWEKSLAAYRQRKELTESECELAWMLCRANPVLSALTWLRWLLVDGKKFDSQQLAIKRFQALANQSVQHS